jgi:hypothetical protein
MLILRIIVALLLVVLGYVSGTAVQLPDLWPYFEALRTTTSIVFGVMGAMLAIVYPEVLQSGLRGADTANTARVDMHRLVDPLAQSAILLVILVALAPLFAWLKVYLVANPSMTSILQGSCFSLFCLLSYWQILILIFVLRPLDVLLGRTDDALLRADARRSIHTNGPGR